MNLPEIFGYVASALVLATFTMRTMIPLRILGIASNIAFIAYGYAAGLLPVLLLHAVLLPLNVYRLAEMYRLIREVREAETGDTDMRWLLPFMTPVSLPAGAILFARGEAADHMYLLTKGRIRIEELDVEVNAGAMLGEIGVFSPHGTRMATATCIDECRLQRISRDKVRELVFQDPRIAFNLIGVVTGRLIEDLRIAEARAGRPEPRPAQ